MEEKPKECLHKLPDHLRYLAPYATKYRLDTDEDIDRAIEELTGEELEDLATVAERVRLQGDLPKVMQFINAYEISEFDDAAWLYFFFGLLDALDLKFD